MHQNQSSDLFAVIFSICVTLAVYLLPSFIAFFRGHPRRWQIAAANLLLGWTFFVWCYCLIVALAPSG